MHDPELNFPAKPVLGSRKLLPLSYLEIKVIFKQSD